MALTVIKSLNWSFALGVCVDIEYSFQRAVVHFSMYDEILSFQYAELKFFARLCCTFPKVGRCKGCFSVKKYGF